MAEASTNGTRAAWIWTAVAAARAWAAAARNLAAWESTRRACKCMAEAAAAGRNAAAAGGEAIGRDGRMNIVALGNATDALDAAVRAQRRARAAFGKAASHARLSAAEWDAAADACGMAAGPEDGRAFRRLAGKAREMAQDADKRAEAAGTDENAARMASDKWTRDAAEWADGGAWSGDRAEWVATQASIGADAEYDRAKWSGAAERAAEVVRGAAEYVQECAAAADRVAAAAKGASAQATTPDALAAAAAWNEAMAAVRMMPDACRMRA